MNIYADKGHKVVAKHFNDGYDSDIQKANDYLDFNRVYTVEYTDVGGWHTDVKLQEFDGITFNSVHFEDFVENNL